MAKVTTGLEHATTIPKFKRHKVSVVLDFPPRCRRGATTDFGLRRQISVEQGKDGQYWNWSGMMLSGFRMEIRMDFKLN
ncbi:hypothetical protein J1N35_025482 [Gossypium stocksii]|uniref:Uncharacterized protein n=1 Tax=Gossypium stocksii TaxID=47602 RepID=A0A9D3V6L9_9ROSI|nr:hypothetical protein J1N35_025482 [Gossypium stocksii]